MKKPTKQVEIVSDVAHSGNYYIIMKIINNLVNKYLRDHPDGTVSWKQTTCYNPNLGQNEIFIAAIITTKELMESPLE